MIRQSGIGLPDQILRLKESGDLEGAAALTDRMLEGDLPRCMRENLLVQREIMRRLGSQFTLTEEEALERIRKDIPDFDREELADLMDDGRLWWIWLSGHRKLLPSCSDTVCRYPEYAGRIRKYPAREENAVHELLDRTGRLNRSRSVMESCGSHSAEIRLRHTLRITDEAFVPGETYRVQIPLPVVCRDQEDVVIHSRSGGSVHIAPEDAPARTICWEETMEVNHPFWVEYSYRYTARHVDPSSIRPDAVQPDFCTEEEAPHIVFTPYIRALCAELTRGLNGPVEKARAIYDYITTHVRYTFTPEYFVVPQIADTCLRTLRGDCGMQALAFIALCRCAGIPARWQSGMVADPETVGNHDWAMFYAAPYGWLYADCSFGGGAYRSGDEARHRHYFGNLDVYRNVTTTEFMADFDVPSRGWRQDPCDNQSGEIERGSCGLPLSAFEKEVICVSFRELQAES